MPGPEDFASVLAELFNSNKAKVFTAMLCVVDSYDKPKRRAALRPMTKIPVLAEDDTYVYEALPVMPSVPIMFPQGGGASIEWELTPGDVVLAVVSTFNERNAVSTNKAGTVAGDTGTHSLASTFGIPGLFTQGPLGELNLRGNPVRLGDDDATEFLAFKSYVDGLASAVQEMVAAGVAVVGATGTLTYVAPTGPSGTTQVVGK